MIKISIVPLANSSTRPPPDLFGDFRRFLLALSHAHVKNSGVEVFALGVQQEERRSVSAHEGLGKVHDFHYQVVHADHVLEYGSGWREGEIGL